MSKVLNFNEEKIKKLTNGHTTDPRTLALFLGMTSIIEFYKDLVGTYPHISQYITKDIDTNHLSSPNGETIDPSLWFSKSPDSLDSYVSMTLIIEDMYKYTTFPDTENLDKHHFLQTTIFQKLFDVVNVVKQTNSFVLLSNTVEYVCFKNSGVIILHSNDNHKIILDLNIAISDTDSSNCLILIKLQYSTELKRAFGENDDVVYSIDSIRQIHDMLNFYFETTKKDQYEE